MSILSLADHTQSSCCQAAAAPPVIHLPIAPQVVARTRFSPPTPVRSRCLSLLEAMQLLDQAIEERGESIGMVAITGPGDPLASSDITLEAITLVRKRYPALRIGLKTMGISSDKLAGDLARAGLHYVEMQVDGVKAEILEKIYAWIRPGMRTLKVREAVELLIREQRNGVPALRFHNIEVTILTTLYPGLNIDHVPKIAAAMLVLGASGMGLVPYTPEPGAEVAMESPDRRIVLAIGEKTRVSLPLVEPLLLEQAVGAGNCAAESLSPLPRPTPTHPNVAVVSSNGIEVDLHLGQAIRFMIYGRRADGLTCLLEIREGPEPGSGADRWAKLAAVLHDCFVILAAAAGETPRRLLAEAGIRVLLTEDVIEGTVDVLYGGGKKGKNV